MIIKNNVKYNKMQETNILEAIPESVHSLLPKTESIPPLRGSLRVKTRARQKSQLKAKTENAMINLLLELPFVKFLPSYTLQDICHFIKLQSFKNHEIILKQGDPINNLYIVKSGSFIFTINHEAISHVSRDINSFIRYQSITEEPFLEKRKYELTGKIKNNEEIPIFIYQSKKLFGDIEIISGRNTSIFNIYANEENSSLYIIDRIKWVKLTKKIRVIFTRLTLKKIEIIYDRILEVLKGKDCLNINKMKLYKQKILEQIEINNNYDIYFNQLEKKKKKLEKELNIYKLDNKNSQSAKEKSMIIQNFRHNKDYLLKLFKYPNILKEDVRVDLDKYLFKIKNKDTQRFKLGKTMSKLNLNQDLSKNDSMQKIEPQNLKSNLFVTNSLKLLRNNSAKNILDKMKILKKLNPKILKNKALQQENINFKSSINFYPTSNSKRKIKEENITPFIKNTNSIEQTSSNINNNNEQVFFQKMKNCVLKNAINKRKINEKIISKPFELKNPKKVNSKNKIMRIYSENKKEKITKDKIDDILNERCKFTKEKLIDKLLGKKEI